MLVQHVYVKYINMYKLDIYHLNADSYHIVHTTHIHSPKCRNMVLMPILYIYVLLHVHSTITTCTCNIIVQLMLTHRYSVTHLTSWIDVLL